MKREHGQHNLDVSQFLLEDAQYPDWVVTTAFYSSVHFVEHALFPLIEGGVEYIDFNEYWRSTSITSKHTCKKKLVNKYLYSVAAAYRELCDDCHNARYNNYNVSDYNAKEAKKKADKIKVACLKLKT